MPAIAFPRRTRHTILAAIEILVLTLSLAILARTLLETLARTNQNAVHQLAASQSEHPTNPHAVDFPPPAGTLPATRVALVAQLDRAADF